MFEQASCSGPLLLVTQVIQSPPGSISAHLLHCHPNGENMSAFCKSDLIVFIDCLKMVTHVYSSEKKTKLLLLGYLFDTFH